MKKLLIAMVLGSLLVLALATTALADNGPHGGFTATDDACAGCHRIHSATSPDGMLLVLPVEALCMSCHNGDGAYTNVEMGFYDVSSYTGSPSGQGDPGEGLFGGGFVEAKMLHTWPGNIGYSRAATASLEPTTSHHTVDGTAGTVWGSNDLNGTNDSLGMECINCHDPHGNAGRTGTNFTTPIASYRLLRFNPTGSGGFEVTTGLTTTYFVTGTLAGAVATGSTGGVWVADIATKWYTPNTNYTIDPTVVAQRSRSGGAFHAYIAGPGDYAGRNFNYRRPAYTLVNTGTERYVCDDGAGNAVPTDITSCANPSAATAGAIWDNTSAYVRMAQWCTLCHDRYLSASGARSNASGDTYYMYRHTAAGSTPTTSLACASCHVSHGTTAIMTNTNANHPTASLTTGSILLKTDERSLCIDCHGTSINFWTSGLITP